MSSSLRPAIKSANTTMILPCHRCGTANTKSPATDNFCPAKEGKCKHARLHCGGCIKLQNDMQLHSILNRPDPGARSTIDGDFPLDENVIVHLPQGAKVLSANRYGSSAWTVIVRIGVELVDGTPKQYFLKCATEDAGQAMMEGEFWAMTELYKTMPNLVPKPLAWGKFRRESPETYFFLCDFADMSSQVPDPERLCTSVAELHRIITSPTGKFGFHARTCNGRTPQATEWDSSWTAFFAKFMSHVMRLDFELNGAWKELEEVEEKVVSHVIPRLIGALEVDGRSVKPCLIHGDLWEGNTGTSYDTGEIYLFDAGSYYGHNEMEIGDWRCPYNEINAKVYTQTYLKKFGMSEPTEEWDDRNRLYSVYYDIIYSCNHTSQGTGVRQMAYENMCYLVGIYAPSLVPKEDVVD